MEKETELIFAKYLLNSIYIITMYVYISLNPYNNQPTFLPPFLPSFLPLKETLSPFQRVNNLSTVRNLGSKMENLSPSVTKAKTVFFPLFLIAFSIRETKAKIYLLQCVWLRLRWRTPVAEIKEVKYKVEIGSLVSNWDRRLDVILQALKNYYRFLEQKIRYKSIL